MKLKPNAFHLAADLIAERQEFFACNAINRTDRCLRVKENPHVQFFTDIFKDSVHLCEVWWSMSGDEQEARILALLLAEILCREHNRELARANRKKKL